MCKFGLSTVSFAKSALSAVHGDWNSSFTVAVHTILLSHQRIIEVSLKLCKQFKRLKPEIYMIFFSSYLSENILCFTETNWLMLFGKISFWLIATITLNTELRIALKLKQVVGVRAVYRALKA